MRASWRPILVCLMKKDVRGKRNAGNTRVGNAVPGVPSGGSPNLYRRPPSAAGTPGTAFPTVSFVLTLERKPRLFDQSKRPWGADTRHDRPKCRIYSNAAGASPGQHTIPNVILLSIGTIVKHNCAKQGAGLQKTLLFYPKEFQKLDIRISIAGATKGRPANSQNWQQFGLIV